MWKWDSGVPLLQESGCTKRLELRGMGEQTFSVRSSDGLSKQLALRCPYNGMTSCWRGGQSGNRPSWRSLDWDPTSEDLPPVLAQLYNSSFLGFG
ncbi:hypothetical protein EYF80_032983 [Liparis tanakae]|uniref:Uncharacterized protein n=1 Tax=Liparis tanakae TaxID=230148 RepID=A0A4Z2GUH9_9TELE|nr:hypothetical protein EYF80_032983 [Liparis tanakae]